MAGSRAAPGPSCPSAWGSSSGRSSSYRRPAAAAARRLEGAGESGHREPQGEEREGAAPLRSSPSGGAGALARGLGRRSETPAGLTAVSSSPVLASGAWAPPAAPRPPPRALLPPPPGWNAGLPPMPSATQPVTQATQHRSGGNPSSLLLCPGGTTRPPPACGPAPRSRPPVPRRAGEKPGAPLTCEEDDDGEGHDLHGLRLRQPLQLEQQPLPQRAHLLHEVRGRHAERGSRGAALSRDRA